MGSGSPHPRQCELGGFLTTLQGRIAPFLLDMMYMKRLVCTLCSPPVGQEHRTPSIPASDGEVSLVFPHAQGSCYEQFPFQDSVCPLPDTQSAICPFLTIPLASLSPTLYLWRLAESQPRTVWPQVIYTWLRSSGSSFSSSPLLFCWPLGLRVYLTIFLLW